MNNDDLHIEAGPDVTVTRRYLTANTVLAALVLIIHGTTLVACVRNRELGGILILAVLSCGVAFGISVLTSSLLAFKRPSALIPVMWIQAALFSVGAVSLLLWAVKLIIFPIRAERFGWGLGALTGIVFYAFSLSRHMITTRLGLDCRFSKLRSNVAVLLLVGIVDVLVLVKATITLEP